MELRVGDLLKEWETGLLRPVYYLLGEEASAKTEALARLKARFKADDFNYREFTDAEAAEAVVAEAMTFPIFSDKRLVIVNNPKIPAAAKTAFVEYLKDPLKSTTLVLLSEEKKADLKDALTAAASRAGAVGVFSPLKEEDAQDRLVAAARQAGKILSPEAAATLVAEAGTNWSILRQELDKALLFRASAKELSQEDVVQCLGFRKSADPFALSKLIQERKLPDCLAHARRLLSDGKVEDQVFRIVSGLSQAVAKQLRAKRLLQARQAPEAILRALRLHQYWDRNYLEAVGRLDEKRLIADLKKCVATEARLKSKSWLDGRLEIEKLIVDLCG